jgi:hypothetical protein
MMSKSQMTGTWLSKINLESFAVYQGECFITVSFINAIASGDKNGTTSQLESFMQIQADCHVIYNV